jgi:hypothetical protein
LGFAPTYFPGTADFSGARRVSVSVGQTVSDINMLLVPVRLARVSGYAVDASGKPLERQFIVTATPRQPIGSAANISSRGGEAGSFAIAGLAPGEYALTVAPRGGNSQGEFLSTQITVDGTDLENVRIAGIRRTTVTGRLVMGRTANAGPMPAAVQVSFAPLDPSDSSVIGNGNAKVEPDLTFRLTINPGAWRVTAASGGWMVESIRHRGTDITESGLEIRPGDDIDGLEIELTNRVTRLSGLVTDERGIAAKESMIEVFSVDPSKWTIEGDTRTLRTGQDGRYSMAAIRPGEYYVVALDDIEPGDASNPELLEHIRSHATKVTIGEGETKTLDLPLVLNR